MWPFNLFNMYEWFCIAGVVAFVFWLVRWIMTFDDNMPMDP